VFLSLVGRLFISQPQFWVLTSVGTGFSDPSYAFIYTKTVWYSQYNLLLWFRVQVAAIWELRPLFSGVANYPVIWPCCTTAQNKFTAISNIGIFGNLGSSILPRKHAFNLIQLGLEWLSATIMDEAPMLRWPGTWSQIVTRFINTSKKIGCHRHLSLWS